MRSYTRRGAAGDLERCGLTNVRADGPEASGDEPIFVLGYQRSGTTLLQSMLGAHHNISAPPEIYFFVRIAGLAAYYGDLHDDSNLRRVIKHTLASPLAALDAYHLDENELFTDIARGPRGYGDVLVAVMGAIAARQGKRRWSEKSPGQRAPANCGARPASEAHSHRPRPPGRRRLHVDRSVGDRWSAACCDRRATAPHRVHRGRTTSRTRAVHDDPLRGSHSRP